MERLSTDVIYWREIRSESTDKWDIAYELKVHKQKGLSMLGLIGCLLTIDVWEFQKLFPLPL